MDPFSATGFVESYILLPVFVLFVVVYKVRNKTKWVKLEDMDIWTGRRELVEEEEDKSPRKRKWWSFISDVVVG